MELEMPRRSFGGSFSSKTVLFGIGALLLIVVLVWAFSGSFSTNTVNAYFTPNNVRQGETVTLIVEVTNTLGENAQVLTVDLANGSYDKNVLAFDRQSDTLNFVARGDVRKFYFTGTVLSDEHPGLYHIDIITELDDQMETVRPAIEIKQ